MSFLDDPGGRRVDESNVAEHDRTWICKRQRYESNGDINYEIHFVDAILNMEHGFLEMGTYSYMRSIQKFGPEIVRNGIRQRY